MVNDISSKSVSSVLYVLGSMHQILNTSFEKMLKNNRTDESVIEYFIYLLFSAN